MFKVVMLAGSALLDLVAAEYTCQIVKLQFGTWRSCLNFLMLCTKKD
jgi:hypothetical protein